MYHGAHRRFNPLTREWVLVSPQRTQRPWQGHVEKAAPPGLPSYDPTCYLCPGNERAGGARNPSYTGTFTFDNDFSALLPADVGVSSQVSNPIPPSLTELFTARPENGICRVICFSQRHDLTLPLLSLDVAENVIETWSRETAELQERPGIAYVQVFENKGAIMGCSNPHPHSQIWAQSQIPNEIEKELTSQQEYHRTHGRPLLLDYLAEEQKRAERVIASNEYFTSLVPFWAVWPFEMIIIAHRAVPDLPALTRNERRALADLFRRVTCRYDNLFETSFPYSMGFHQAPNNGAQHPEWVLHAHFYPPLLRSATVRKFMVGYEMLAMPQRDITPETAAARLRELPEIHYSQR
jgi:UDPglucose--hexose-1-phosphate uridylyltransferase